MNIQLMSETTDSPSRPIDQSVEEVQICHKFHTSHQIDIKFVEYKSR